MARDQVACGPIILPLLRVSSAGQVISSRSCAMPRIAPKTCPSDVPARHPGRCGGQINRKKKHMATGTVKWFNTEKGFGFIAPDDGSADLFAHYSAIASSGFKELTENQKVEFDAERGPKGMQAMNIRGL
ncbi:hypothetical protein GCM10025863_23240 [Microbacterium suwonense]|uniref:CSD domain-containing protein n=2 Tax=Microbacterium suwonense TaxID=683047 RepID=A0ABM8FVN5_9MICO|nr:hypothetical protein GCM10025863_23240 [Microbacterium suwonense]